MEIEFKVSERYTEAAKREAIETGCTHEKVESKWHDLDFETKNSEHIQTIEFKFCSDCGHTVGLTLH